MLQKASEYSETQLKEKIESIVRGWLNYFKLTETDKRKLLTQPETKFKDQAESIPNTILQAALAYQLGDYNRAQKTMDTAATITSEDADINFQWGVLCDLLDMKNEALDSYLTAHLLNTEHPEAAYRLGLYYLKHNQNGQAIRYLQKAVEINPTNAAAHFALGAAFQNEFMDGAAEVAFSKAIEKDPAIKKLIAKISPKTKPPAQAPDVQFNSQDIPFVLRLFSGREGVFSRQWLGDSGKTGYNTVFRHVDEKEIELHLKGEQTLGYYLMRSDNTVAQLAFDIDITPILHYICYNLLKLLKIVSSVILPKILCLEFLTLRKIGV